jgi:twitching motility protein PilT
MLHLDDLLNQLMTQKGDLLQLQVKQPPTITTDGSAQQLPIAPLDQQVLKDLVDSLVGEGDRPTQIDANTLAGTHEMTGVGEFEYRIRRKNKTMVASIRPKSEIVEVSENVDSALSVRSIEELLKSAIAQQASDILVTSDMPGTIRLTGKLAEVPNAIFSAEEILEALGDVLPEHSESILNNQGSVDVAFTIDIEGHAEPQRFRVNLFRHEGGLAAAFRPIWDTVPSFEELHLPPQLKTLGNYPHGLVLVTGPTGSGKSTTLSCLIDHVNTTQSKHILTLEDPIEYLYTRKQCLIHQREVGVHVSDFATGLRAALREDPDIILVGEMRDRETISAAITAGETGHLVLSTLHSGTAAQAIDRMIDVFPEHQQNQVRMQLSDVLRTVVTQRLLPRIGNRGRIPAIELMQVNLAVANIIREKKTHMLTNQMQTSQSEGMLPFDTSLIQLVQQGEISKDTALNAAHDRKNLEIQLRDLGN